MSVRTQADDARDRAREMIQTAIENLADILISEVWGSDEYSVEYTAKLNEAFDTLRRVKRLLG